MENLLFYLFWKTTINNSLLKVCSYYTSLCCCLVAKSCLTLCNPMDCIPPSSSVHGISQAGILEWVAISFSKGSSWTWDRIPPCVSPALRADSLPLSHWGRPI